MSTIFSKRLKGLMIISLNNAKFMIMVVVVSCLILSVELINLYLTTDQIVVIQKYSIKKAHGCDEISVGMLQLCATEAVVTYMSRNQHRLNYTN